MEKVRHGCQQAVNLLRVWVREREREGLKEKEMENGGRRKKRKGTVKGIM